MNTAELRAITLEALDLETASLAGETHPQIVAGHRAAIKDLKDRLDDIQRSNRLSDKVRIYA